MIGPILEGMDKPVQPVARSDGVDISSIWQQFAVDAIRWILIGRRWLQTWQQNLRFR